MVLALLAGAALYWNEMAGQQHSGAVVHLKREMKGQAKDASFAAAAQKLRTYEVGEIEADRKVEADGNSIT